MFEFWNSLRLRSMDCARVIVERTKVNKYRQFYREFDRNPRIDQSETESNESRGMKIIKQTAYANSLWAIGDTFLIKIATR